MAQSRTVYAQPPTDVGLGNAGLPVRGRAAATGPPLGARRNLRLSLAVEGEQHALKGIGPRNARGNFRCERRPWRAGPDHQGRFEKFHRAIIVAELYAASLEEAGYKVDRKINLGATLVAHEALKSGAIDIYPEYTGTGVLAVMKATGKQDTDPRKILDMVRSHYEKEFNLTWLEPSKINNGYAIVVRPDTAPSTS
jgi:hypothetical protein